MTSTVETRSKADNMQATTLKPVDSSSQKISIFGLGYVGAVSLACLARDGHAVTGVDIDPNKLALIKSGKSPIIEADMPELMQAVVEAGRVSVTEDVVKATIDTDISFVCVGTPSQPNGDQDQRAILSVTESLGEAIKQKDDFHVVIYRSTLRPGTVQETLIPMLEEVSGKKSGEDFAVCFQPEFLREGTSIRDYGNPPFTVVGSDSERAIEMVRTLFADLPCEFQVTDIGTAEILKYFCNIFHALKISFANEVGRLCQSIGANSLEVMRLLCEDKQLNISKAYLKPGFAYGGSCLPKDLRAMMHLARHHDIEVPMLANVAESNKVHIKQAFKFIQSTGVKRVTMLGLSFKSGTDDLRESPLVTLAEQLIGKGYELRIYDPEVNVARLIGANKRFIEEAIPHIGDLLVEEADEAIEASELVVLGLSNPALSEAVVEHTSANHIVLDLVDMQSQEKLSARYQGICW